MSERARGAFAHAARFWQRGYDDNLIGLSAMLAYYLLLSILPLALLALFVAGSLLESSSFEERVLDDLRRLFPATAQSTLTGVLDQVRTSSTGYGVLAIAGSIWIGSSFWAGLDTAFCRIYHFPCRSWLRQRGFALLMLIVVLLFLAATILVPTIQGVLIEGRQDLPFGLDDVEVLVYVGTLAISVVAIFAILCTIYWTVPNRRLPWRAVWPGASLATVAITIVEYGFPIYLSTVSTLADIGTSLVFILIVLLWFYALAVIILAGATINAMRFELEETGELKVRPWGG